MTNSRKATNCSSAAFAELLASKAGLDTGVLNALELVLQATPHP